MQCSLKNKNQWKSSQWMKSEVFNKPRIQPCPCMPPPCPSQSNPSPGTRSGMFSPRAEGSVAFSGKVIGLCWPTLWASSSWVTNTYFLDDSLGPRVQPNPAILLSSQFIGRLIVYPWPHGLVLEPSEPCGPRHWSHWHVLVTKHLSCSLRKNIKIYQHSYSSGRWGIVPSS